MYKLAITAIAISLLSGCSWLQVGSSEYGCKGMPDGVTCKSAREVYNMTENEDFRTQIDADNAKKAKDGDIDCPECEAKAGTAAPEPQGPNFAAGEKYVVPQPARNPLPIRTQATVMRIWVAPWESESGDLNVPGYMYTEIEPRRWEIGTPAPKPTASLRPLAVSKPQNPSQTQKTTQPLANQ